MRWGDFVRPSVRPEPGGCVVCGTADVAVQLHDGEREGGGGVVRSYCAEHAPFQLAPADGGPSAEERVGAGARDAETLYEASVARLRAGDADAASRL